MLKKKIGTVVKRSIFSVSPSDAAGEAVRIMDEMRISCVVVLENERLVGMFTERNVVAALARFGLDFAARPVSEFMTAPAIGVSVDTYAYEAYNLLVANQTRHLVVLDERDMAVGVLTQSDIVRNIGYEYFVELKKISQIMNRSIYAVTAGTPMAEVVSQMAGREIGCAVVVDENAVPRGMITERDVARLARHGDPAMSTTPAEEVMSSPVVAVAYDHPVFEAAQLLERLGIRRLPVVGADGSLVGITTQSDIVQGLEAKYIEILKALILEKDSALKASMEDLNEQKLYLDNILKSSIDMGIAATDKDLVLTYFNPTARDILGHEGDSLLGHSLFDIHEHLGVDPERLKKGLEAINEKNSYSFSLTKGTEEEPRHIQARVTSIQDPDGTVAGYVLMLKDVTERKQAEDIIRHMAYHDALTGLPNRLLFKERLLLELSKAKRYGKRLGVLMMDLDRFKEVNDTLGHQAGDALLKSVGERLRAALRESDTVARMGGDEFLFIVPDLARKDDLERVAEKLTDCLDEPFALGDNLIKVHASIGAALYPHHGAEPDALVGMADNAMYKAKEVSRRLSRSNVFITPVL